MRKTAYRTPNDIMEMGFKALVEKLGPGGAIQFINQYEKGEGNYTRERKALLKGFKLESLK
jgi:hypothetical protein